ncbi:MAG: bifunctional precorrin-2 dehydrogenase/sirohydrochlorin ferrochelatase [Deltaproteobacteria bacterium]|nr:bifunctional precorrin-2 dehydrogenase/sirohydrochlorin ferrochelatase [Deltaproteobacteria bacterium]
MKYYPVFLRIKARLCLVVGGGRVAERKVKGLLECGAKVVVVSPELTACLRELYDERVISWQARVYHRDDITGAILAIAATDDPGVQDMVAADAERHNIMLNVVDVPAKCNFILPALVKRGDLAIAISTSGNSPALAKKLRHELAAQIGREYEILNNLMGILRPEVMARGLPQNDNEQLFGRLLTDDMLIWLRDNNWPQIKAHFESIIGVLPEALQNSLRDVIAA